VNRAVEIGLNGARNTVNISVDFGVIGARNTVNSAFGFGVNFARDTVNGAVDFGVKCARNTVDYECDSTLKDDDLVQDFNEIINQMVLVNNSVFAKYFAQNYRYLSMS
jgi:hypothetical protein